MVMIMNLRFEKINSTNREQVELLHLLPEQEGFIESVHECLEEADERKEWRPVAIYDNSTLVGFAMYGFFSQPSSAGQAWLDRLLIDSRYQGSGYGKLAVSALLNRIQTEYQCREVYLSVYEDNIGAIRLYEKIGFQFNGELDTKGEKIMVYIFK